MSLNVVILAAGKGTRMHSELPKVLQPLSNKPLLQYVLDASQRLKPTTITVITGYKTELVKSSVTSRNVSWRLQEEQLGTGHAVQQAIPDLFANKTLILYGDVPLIDESDLQALIKKADLGLAILTFENNSPAGYGRIVRNEKEICRRERL